MSWRLLFMVQRTGGVLDISVLPWSPQEVSLLHALCFSLADSRQTNKSIKSIHVPLPLGTRWSALAQHDQPQNLFSQLTPSKPQGDDSPHIWPYDFKTKGKCMWILWILWVEIRYKHRFRWGNVWMAEALRWEKRQINYLVNSFLSIKVNAIDYCIMQYSFPLSCIYLFCFSSCFSS